MGNDHGLEEAPALTGAYVRITFSADARLARARDREILPLQ